MTEISGMVMTPPRGRDEQDLVDLVHLDELHLHALAAGGRQVLADVVGTDRQLAMAAVADHGELDAGGAAVVEQRLDRGADRPAGVEDVVDEDAGPAFEREVEPRRADERLRMQRRLAAAHLDVVAVEGDVDGAERDLGAGELLDQPPQPLGEEDAARVDADERDLVELRSLRLDDLVGDAVKGALERLCVERAPALRRARLQACSIRLLSGLSGPG